MNERSDTVPSLGSRSTKVALLSRMYCAQTIADRMRDTSHFRLKRAWMMGTAFLLTGRIAMLPCSRTTTVRLIGALDELTLVDWNVAGSCTPAPRPGVRCAASM